MADFFSSLNCCKGVNKHFIEKNLILDSFSFVKFCFATNLFIVFFVLSFFKMKLNNFLNQNYLILISLVKAFQFQNQIANFRTCCITSIFMILLSIWLNDFKFYSHYVLIIY